MFQGLPSQCDTSLLLEYFDFLRYQYYIVVGYRNSCISIVQEIGFRFCLDDLKRAVTILNEAHALKR